MTASVRFIVAGHINSP